MYNSQHEYSSFTYRPPKRASFIGTFTNFINKESTKINQESPTENDTYKAFAHIIIMAHNDNTIGAAFGVHSKL